LTVGGAGNISIASIIGTTSGTLTKDGAGTLTLSGANTYTGATTVSAGVLNIKHANALGTTAARTSVTSGAALQIQGGITTAAEALTLNGTGVSSDGALRNISGTNTYAGLVTLGAATRINSDAGTLTLSHAGTITGAFGLTVGGAGNTTISSIIGTTSGTLTKDGAGTLTLSSSAANTYTGATTVSAGILNLQNATGLGSTAGSTTVSHGATLQLQGGIAVGEEALSLNGGAASGQTGALVNVSGTNTYGGAVTVTASSSISAASGSVLNLTGGVVKNGTVATFNGGGTINVNTVAISGASANSDLVIDGTTVNVDVASSYNGPTFIRNGGTLNANVTNALPTANGRTAVTFDGTGTSVLSLGAAQSVASLTSAGASTVTLGANALTVGTSTGSTSFDGIIGGTGGLIKDGASTQVLTGANTYTGATTVSAGTLEVSGASGALTATSAVNINGGTVSLSGSAADRISDTASISLGAATGSTLQLSGAVIETLGAMTLAGGVGARVIDFGVTSGVLTLASLSAASNLPLHIWNWSGTTGTGGGTDRLVISSGFLGGSLAASNVSFFSGSGTGLYSEATTFTSGGELVPSVSVSVPEPGTFFPAAVLVAGALLRRRRGRCRAARA
jgi:autotransporter-associated beta strand protein